MVPLHHYQLVIINSTTLKITHQRICVLELMLNGLYVTNIVLLCATVLSRKQAQNTQNLRLCVVQRFLKKNEV